MAQSKRVQTIVYILKNNAHYTCKHITYKIVDDNVHIRSSNDNFYATSVISELEGIFNTFLTVEDGKIVLIVY